MTYQSPHDVQRDALLTAARAASVAAVAGVDPAAWASTTAPRVLPGDAAGYLGGLHRGRLPAVEVFQLADQWTRQAASGGTILTTWGLRAHAPDLTKQDAESRCRVILLAALAALRAVGYLEEGGEEFDAVQHGPLGHSLTVRVSLAHTFCRSTYELVEILPPSLTVTETDPSSVPENVDPPFTLTGTGFVSIGVDALSVYAEGYPEEAQGLGTWTVDGDTQLTIPFNVVLRALSSANAVGLTPPFNAIIVVSPVGGGADVEAPSFLITPAP